MHLNKILEQIKRHQSPTEAIDKLATALEKHEGSLLEKGFTILKSELAANMYEAINGPHFDEEHARYAVEGMENEDGTKGPHWTVEETTSVANQMGINLKSEKHNKWDWFVAMNMIYSDFYKAVVAMTGSANTKYFAELAKAWLCDKDISEGKMWHYYVYIMCDDEENDYKAYERMHRDHENVNSDITTNVTKDFKELDDLKAEVKELKQLLQNVSAVRPEVIKNTPPNSAEDKKVEPEGEIKKEI